MWTQNRKLKVINRFPQIAAKASADKGLKFNSLIHHINEELLCRVASELKVDKATGIDGISVPEYSSNLKENVKDLVARMKAKSYRPKPVRRVVRPAKADIFSGGISKSHQSKSQNSVAWVATLREIKMLKPTDKPI